MTFYFTIVSRLNIYSIPQLKRVCLEREAGFKLRVVRIMKLSPQRFKVTERLGVNLVAWEDSSNLSLQTEVVVRSERKGTNHLYENYNDLCIGSSFRGTLFHGLQIERSAYIL